MAQVPDFQQALVQGFDKNRRAGLRALPETGHAEDDVVRLRVVAGAVAVGHHRTVTAEHFHRGWDLKTAGDEAGEWSACVDVRPTLNVPPHSLDAKRERYLTGGQDESVTSQVGFVAKDLWTLHVEFLGAL